MPDRSKRLIWFILPVIAIGVIVVGLWPGTESAPDPEARAYNLSIRLKCPICAGESIAGSQTDVEIIAMFVASYGEQVLLDPPSTGWGAALWAVPLGVLVIGGIAIFGLRRKDREPVGVEK